MDKKYLRIIISVGIGAITFAVIVLYPLVFVDYGFSQYVKVRAAESILTTLIEVVGVLIAFSGVIFAQLYLSLSDQQNVLYQYVLENSWIASDHMKKFNSYSNKQIQLSILMGLTFLFFILSIFASITKIGALYNYSATDTIAAFSTFYQPFSFLIGGAFIIVFTFGALSIKPFFDKKSNDSKENSPIVPSTLND